MQVFSARGAEQGLFEHRRRRTSPFRVDSRLAVTHYWAAAEEGTPPKPRRHAGLVSLGVLAEKAHDSGSRGGTRPSYSFGHHNGAPRFHLAHRSSEATAQNFWLTPSKVPTYLRWLERPCVFPCTSACARNTGPAVLSFGADGGRNPFRAPHSKPKQKRHLGSSRHVTTARAFFCQSRGQLCNSTQAQRRRYELSMHSVRCQCELLVTACISRSRGTPSAYPDKPAPRQRTTAANLALKFQNPTRPLPVKMSFTTRR